MFERAAAGGGQFARAHRDRVRLPVLLALAAIPLLIPSEHLASVGRTAAIYAVLALGYAVVFGLCGQFTMAHAAVYGVGAYATAILSAGGRLGVWLTLPVSIGVAAIAAGVIGLAALRVRGDLLAVVTLAIGQLIQLVILDWTPVTGGNGGISDIPPLPFAGSTLIDEHALYLVALIALVVSVLAVDRFKGTRAGLAMESIRDDPVLAGSVGIRVGGYKVIAFAISGAFAGVAGWLEATSIGAVSPTTFDVVLSVLIAVMVLMAGSGRVYGVLAAAAFMAGLQDILNPWPLVETGTIGTAIVGTVLWRSGALRRTRARSALAHAA